MITRSSGRDQTLFGFAVAPSFVLISFLLLYNGGCSLRIVFGWISCCASRVWTKSLTSHVQTSVVNLAASSAFWLPRVMVSFIFWSSFQYMTASFLGFHMAARSCRISFPFLICLPAVRMSCSSHSLNWQELYQRHICTYIYLFIFCPVKGLNKCPKFGLLRRPIGGRGPFEGEVTTA